MSAPARSSRVVVTGMGAVSCLGPDVASFWDGLAAGRSGIAPIRKYDSAGIRNPEAGEVYELPAGRLPEWATALDEAARFALAAASEAADAAGVIPGDLGVKTGVILATNFGGAGTFQQWASCYLEEKPAPELFNQALMPVATDAVANYLGARGPRATLSLSCSSGAAAIGLAADWIRLGRADRVIAGGYDALTLYSLAGLSCLRTVTTGKLRPFDKNRSGTVFGDGAGILVLESENAAEARGAEPLGVVAGWASNNNAYHLTAPESKGAGYIQVMEAACRDAHRSAEDIGYINAHGTGTKYNDPAETAAIHAFLGSRAATVPVSSIKAAISHTMGAAGSLEAIATLMAIRTGILPPTLNWEERDPDCDLDYIPNEARHEAVTCAASLSSGIGGNNAALILEKYA